MSSSIVFEETRKKRCTECGKILNIFEGYRHPTMGIHFIICRECYDKVETSVERWGRFVLWNSFNPDAPDPTYLDNFPFPQEDSTVSHKKVRHPRHYH